jgi:excisionase family DNA binding protein
MGEAPAAVHGGDLALALRYASAGLLVFTPAQTKLASQARREVTMALNGEVPRRGRRRERREERSDKGWLKVAEVASLMNVSIRTVRRLIAAGTLPVKRVRRAVRVCRNDVDEYMQSG